MFNPFPDTSLKTGLTSLFGLSNLYLLKQSTDYFAPSTELNVFTHTWSLGVEEQFYILFPFLIWFSGFGRETKNGARNLFLIVGILTIASLIGFLYLYPTNQSAAYFLMPSRFWEMAAGCLIFLGFQKRASIEQSLEKVPPLLVVALMIGVMYLPMSMASGSTIAIVALSSILIACLKKQTAAFKVFTYPKVVYIGLISYSLYLWHWGVLSISRWTIGIHWWSVPFQVVLMLGLAVTSYRWIENPLRKGNWFGKRWKTLVVGGGVLVTLSGGLIALYLPLRGKLYSGSKTDCKPFQYNTCAGIDEPHTPTTPFITGTSIQRKDCFLYKGSISELIINRCSVTPTTKDSPNIFVVGSSYVHHLSPAFESLREEYGVGITMSVVTGCDLDPLLLKENRKGTCKESNAIRKDHIIKNAKKDDIIFAGTTSERINSNSVKEIAALGRRLKAHIIYTTPIPAWKRLGTGIDHRCRTTGNAKVWFNLEDGHNCSNYSEISRALYNKKTSDTIQTLNNLERSNPYFHVYRLHEFLCNSSTCPSHIDSVRLYRDNTGHISVHASREFIGDHLENFLIGRNLMPTKKKIK